MKCAAPFASCFTSGMPAKPIQLQSFFHHAFMLRESEAYAHCRHIVRKDAPGDEAVRQPTSVLPATAIS